MKKVLILTGFLILGFAAISFGLTLDFKGWIDAPHNVTNNISCNDCHTAAGFPGNALCLSCHINATGGGYSKNNAPAVLTHSSATTSTKYGTWAINCVDCHQQHYQAQTFNQFSTVITTQSYLVTGKLTTVTDNGNGTSTFGYNSITVNSPAWSDVTKWGAKTSKERGLILFPNVAVTQAPGTQMGVSFEVKSATATTITVKGSIAPTYTGLFSAGNTFALVYGQLVDNFIYLGSTPMNSSFLDQTGPNSFAFNETGDPTKPDPTPDGVCQVCHTKTKHWRSDGTRADHNSGLRCTTCHLHQQGFKPNCNTCHGNPPVVNTLGGPNGLVNTPAATGSTSAGAHVKHATSGVGDYGFACDKCHVGGMDTTGIPTFKITMGFDISTTYQSGTYDGRTLPLPNGYSYSAGNAGTTITNNGTQTCTNIYCHSNAKIGTSVQAYATPIWTDWAADLFTLP